MEPTDLHHKRCDPTGRAHAGSQRQIQHYVNHEPRLLEHEIALALNKRISLRWVSPLSTELYREYHDTAFLEALDLARHRRALSNFWPNRGPVWDALALETLTDGVVLLEAKSHLAEIRGGGCKAAATTSVQKIDAAMMQTKEWLGIDQGVDWKGELYQSANRIAHLHFFRNVLAIPAWLVNVYFLDDPHSPTARSQWIPGIQDVKKRLGLSNTPFCADIFLPAIP
jgi:hypothetical protein